MAPPEAKAEAQTGAGGEAAGRPQYKKAGRNQSHLPQETMFPTLSRIGLVSSGMGLHDIVVRTIDGKEASLGEFQGKALLVVNVASKCGFTPQYEALQKLYEEYRPKGLEILGFPCNQFMSQEPGTNDEIKEFCSLTYGVSFPMFDKVEVNGDERHPLYTELTAHPDPDGKAGDVGWNFEKFVVSPEGEVVGRFRTPVAPDAPEVVKVIEEQLPGSD